MNHTITIRVKGGLLQSVEGVPPGITVRVLDFDTEGTQEPESIIKVDGEPCLESLHECEVESASNTTQSEH